MAMGLFRRCLGRHLLLTVGLMLVALCLLYIKRSVQLTPRAFSSILQQVQGDIPEEFRGMLAQERPAPDENSFAFLPWNLLSSGKLRPDDWKSSHYCDVNCSTKVPCVYRDEVDLRIIVLGANRAKSLEKSLRSLHGLDMLGDRVAVDIWLDKLEDGTVHNESRDVAVTFASHWKEGRACVHTQTAHASTANQWVYSYRPRDNTNEIALFVEDDLDLSPLAYKWLKAAHAHYRGTPDVSGFSLKSEILRLRSVANRQGDLRGPKQHPSFMYPVISSWGYSPIPWVWREFQIFFHEVRKNDTAKPYVDGYLHTAWYKWLEKKGTTETMAHEMWHIYFTQNKHLFTVYNNLLEYIGRKDVQLTTNRMEDGLHFSGMTQDNHKNLLTSWNDSFVDFPSQESTARLDINGVPIA